MCGFSYDYNLQAEMASAKEDEQQVRQRMLQMQEHIYVVL